MRAQEYNDIRPSHKEQITSLQGGRVEFISNIHGKTLAAGLPVARDLWQRSVRFWQRPEGFWQRLVAFGSGRRSFGSGQTPFKIPEAIGYPDFFNFKGSRGIKVSIFFKTNKHKFNFKLFRLWRALQLARGQSINQLELISSGLEPSPKI